MSYIHPLADVATTSIGEGTKIWQFVVIMKGSRIGKDCNICAQVLIENDVVIGDRVTLKSGVQLWNGTRIEDDVFIGPNVTFTNDRYPRSKEYPDKFSGITIKRNASIGANATLLPGITIGEYAMIGAGSVVLNDVPAKCVLVGNPARITKQII
jgi:UDP-2-acetamido-3-amino-2,3-dideoxy-glucuronate N-acetyltransferase